MGMRRMLLAMGVVALSGCASSDYGYAYCYDSYLAPTGHYYGPLEPKPNCPAPSAGSTYYLGPHPASYRGPYLSGPYNRPAPTPAAAR